MKQITGLVVLAILAVMVQADNVMAETKRSGEMVTPVKEDQTIKDQGIDAPSMKQVLLHPKGFEMEWSCGGRSGRSRVYFRDEGEKIVADIYVVDIENVDINKPENYGSESCTTEAKLTGTGFVFYGCSSASRDNLLVYDPGNQKTPFKGSGRGCSTIEFSPW